ncbi:hypothetical protein SK128_000685, partial [Halocaridina rubra]
RMFDVEAMAEKKQVRLMTDETVSTSQKINTSKCLICQKSPPERTMGSDAALIRDDIVRKRLKMTDQEDFVYHMNNSCYKAYTMKSHLDRIASKDPEDNAPKRTVRSSVGARPKHLQKPKLLNKSELFFSNGVSPETMADKIRGTDPIRECAAIIWQCLLEVDFDLQDRFCDATDLKTSLLKFMGALYNFDPT